MSTKMDYSTRAFNCKIEELVMICRFGLIIARRDMADFMSFSPMFNETYFNEFETKIIAADELVSPKAETEEMKRITKVLHGQIESLLEPINKLRGYLKITRTTIGMSDKDFGISALGKRIHAIDAEGVRQNLIFLNKNVQTYKTQLLAVGMSEESIDFLALSVDSITELNQQQFEIHSLRKLTVSENIGKLNELYGNLMEFLNIGRVIYKTVDLVKAKEYTFENLKKNVRLTWPSKGSADAKQTKQEEQQL